MMKCKICKKIYSIKRMETDDGICSKCRCSTLGALIKRKLIDPKMFNSLKENKKQINFSKKELI